MNCEIVAISNNNKNRLNPLKKLAHKKVGTAISHCVFLKKGVEAFSTILRKRKRRKLSKHDDHLTKKMMVFVVRERAATRLARIWYDDRTNYRVDTGSSDVFMMFHHDIFINLSL